VYKPVHIILLCKFSKASAKTKKLIYGFYASKMSITKTRCNA
jgi:hypothetical protein